MDESWISLEIVTKIIARDFQVPKGIAQRRVTEAINEGVRARGAPRPDNFNHFWNSSGSRWPTRPNPDPKRPDYTDLSPNIWASAAIDWEKGSLHHPNFSGEVVLIELEENDFRYWLKRIGEPMKPDHTTPNNLGERIQQCIDWLRKQSTSNRDNLKPAAKKATPGLTDREFQIAYGLVHQRKRRSPKDMSQKN